MIGELFAVSCDLETIISVDRLSRAKATLCGHTETGMWRQCLRPKKVILRTFRRQEKCFKCDSIHERPKNVCILAGF